MSKYFDAVKVTEELVEWTRKWFEENGNGCNAVIGISGGKDSTVCAAICARALGKERVIGILMPDGEQKDLEDAVALCRHLGIEYSILNIQSITEAALATVQTGLKQLSGAEEISVQTKTNLPPRIRMSLLYAVSQSRNGRVINTCNLSEDYVGYSTRYGDAAGDVSLLGGLTVTEVKLVGKQLGIPEYLVEKAPSDGLTGKTDEDNLGFSYATLDRYIRTGQCEDEKKKKMMEKRHKANEFKLKPLPYYHP